MSFQVSDRTFYVVVVGDNIEVVNTRDTAIERLHELIRSSPNVSENDVYLCEIRVERAGEGADHRRLLRIDHVSWPRIVIELARRATREQESHEPPRARRGGGRSRTTAGGGQVGGQGGGEERQN